MKKVKITILKTMLNEDLAKQYGIPGLKACRDWIKEPGVAIVSCNDGLRPVIMKLEATDEDATIEYEPVER